MLLDAVPTEEQTLERMGPREQDLRYLTQHFQDLQGLKTLPIFAAFGLLLCFLPGRPTAEILWVFFGALVLGVFLMARTQRWYETRFGLVRDTRTKPEMREGFLPSYLILFLLMIFLASRPGKHPDGAIFLVVVNMLLLPKCFFRTPKNGWVQLRRWLYVASTAGLVSLITFIALLHVSHRSLQLILAAYCAVFVLLGLYDHWLLGYLVRPRRMEEGGA
jgi:hypothetical protein